MANGKDTKSVSISGNTYPVRRALKHLGAIYHPSNRSWTIDEAKADIARTIMRNGSPYVRCRTSTDAQTKTFTVDLSRPVYCSCERELPEAARTPFVLEGNALTHHCGKTVEIVLEQREYVAEVRRCRECGREFTYRECKRDGEWADSYCGC